MPIQHVVPEITVVVGAAVVLVTVLFVPREREWVAVPLALLTLAVAAGATIDVAVGGEPIVTMRSTWALDDVTHAARLVVLASTALAVLLAPAWLATDRRRGEYHVLLLLSALGAMLLAGAADTMQLVVAMILVSVTGYSLAAYHRGDDASVEAGMKFFLIGGLANIVLLVGVVVLFGATGATGYQEIARSLAATASTPALVAAAACIAVGVAFELGAVPAHAWMPDVAQGAPAPAAAFLTVVPKVGALVALARVLPLLPAGEVGWRPLVAVLAVLTMTLGNLAALWQQDVRRLLGWSSVSQSGYGLMAVVVIGLTPDAVPALVAFLVAYAAANMAAFGVVVHLRGRSAIADYEGLASTRPWAAAAMAVAMLSLVGIPPLAGFVAKLELFTAAIDGGYAWLAAVAVVNTVVSLFYYLRVIGPMYLAGGPTRVPVLGRLAGTATGIATAAVVLTGVVAGALLAPLQGTPLLP